MSIRISRRGALVGAGAVLAANRVSAAASMAVDPDDYDALSDEQLGASNRAVHIATQPAGEWYGMGISSYQGGDEGYRWQIGWWLQPLAITQYRLPAYRELYKRSFEGFVGKMQHRDTWSYWEAQSMGIRDSLGVPGRDKPTADPLARDNINYSANTLSLMTMHQMLYRDDTYLKPHSFVLKHWTKDGLQVFDYDLGKVAKAVHDGFAETGWRGVACEVNGVYPAYCNQLAMVAFKQYDDVVPGDMGAQVIARHTRVWQEISDLYKMGAHKPGGPEPFIPRAYYVKEDALVAMGDTMMTSAAYVNAWNHPWVRENYPYWKKRFSVNDGIVSVNLEPQVRGHLDHNPYAPRPEPTAPVWTRAGETERGETPPFYYYAAISAAEMGDAEYLTTIRGHAEKLGNAPVWKGSEFFYDRNELTGVARMSRGSSVLMTAAHLVEKDSFRTLYNRPWTAEDAAIPQLEQVDWPNVLVRRAAYDRANEALVLTLLSAEGLRNPAAPGREATFAISNLDPARTYVVTRDGAVLGQLKGGQVSGDASAVLRWADGRLLLNGVIGGDTSYVVQAA